MSIYKYKALVALLFINWFETLASRFKDDNMSYTLITVVIILEVGMFLYNDYKAVTTDE